MAALTRYADDRARYDATYIRDVYENVEAASSQFKLPANTTWPGVATTLGDVRACLSMKVVGAVLVHAAWVAPLVRLRRDLAYAPH